MSFWAVSWAPQKVQMKARINSVFCLIIVCISKSKEKCICSASIFISMLLLYRCLEINIHFYYMGYWKCKAELPFSKWYEFNYTCFLYLLKLLKSSLKYWFKFWFMSSCKWHSFLSSKILHWSCSWVHFLSLWMIAFMCE